MKNTMRCLVIALVAVIGFSFTACGDGGGDDGDSNSATYTGYDSEGTEYKLVISKGSNNPGGGGGGDDGGGGGGGGNSSLNGTWVNESEEVWVFNNGNLTVSDYGEEFLKGTYTTSGSSITLTFTQIKGSAFGAEASEIGLSSDEWYTKSQLRTAVMNYYSLEADDVDEILAEFYAFYEPMTGQYSLSGDTLTITDEDGVTIFTKQDGRSAVAVSLSSSAGRAGYIPHQGDNYTLIIGGSDTSTGTVISFSGTTITLEHKDGEGFSVTVSGSGITAFSVDIPLDGGGTHTKPETLTPYRPGGGGGGGGDDGDGPSTWVAAADSISGMSGVYDIAYGNNKFVAVGYNYLNSDYISKIAYSTDGASWTVVDDSALGGYSITAIAYGGNKFVAGDTQGGLVYSDDGENWTAVSNSPLSKDYVNAIAYGGNRFVAVVGGENPIAYSSDGENWAAASISAFGLYTIDAIAYGGNRFIAGDSEGKLAYSSDGASWTVVSNKPFGNTYSIDTIAYGGNRWVIANSQGKVAYSLDGTSWTTVSDSTFGISDIIEDIAYGNGRFVAVCFSGTIAYSTNGQSWTSVLGSPFTSYTQYYVAYGGGKFVAASSSGKTAYANW